MRVWLVAGFEPLPQWDGDVRYLRCGMLAGALLARGHEVTLWTSDFNHLRKVARSGPPRAVEPSGLAVRLLHGRPYRRNVSIARLLHQRQVAAAFRFSATGATAPDIIVASFPTIELAAASVDYAATRSIPVVVDIRDLWPDQYLTVLPSWARPTGRLLLQGTFGRAQRVLSGASALTAVSPSYLQWGQALAGGARSHDQVVYLGAPLSAVDAKPSPTLPSLPDGLLFTYVGQFGSSYDLSTVIAAARILEERCVRDVTFVLVGDGDDGSRLRRQGRGLANVVFTGWLHPPAIAGVLANSHAGIAAYRATATQSLPNKPFEFMAAGLPILSSLTGDLQELIERERIGVHYTAGNPLALVSAVEKMRDPIARQRMASAASTLFREQFEQQRVYERFSSYLESLLRESARIAHGRTWAS